MPTGARRLLELPGRDQPCASARTDGIDHSNPAAVIRSPAEATSGIGQKQPLNNQLISFVVRRPTSSAEQLGNARRQRLASSQANRNQRDAATADFSSEQSAFYADFIPEPP